MSSFLKLIKVGARASRLSQAQVWEVLAELRQHHPAIEFSPLWVSTQGDLDLKTSLRTLGRTDFFTREIDQLLLSGACRIAIHSAKDLPDPLPEGLQVAALTRGVDSSDSLVLRDKESVQTLPQNARIGTSSLRREEAIRAFRPDFVCVDIRGTIDRRLQLLDEGEVDGIAMAEAALIRLGLTHRTRVPLPGEIAPGQGQLAVLIRSEDEEMLSLFMCIDEKNSLLRH